MPIRNQAWYNSNESRDYPLDDKASCVSDAGARLLQNIITDLRLRYPSSLGRFPFVSAVSVTPMAVTVTIQAATTVDNSDRSCVPIAVITVQRDSLLEGRQFALQAQYPGVFGYIAFGSGCQARYSGRFSSPLQTLISPRACRTYRELPITGISKLFNSTPLTGLVQLLGNAPLEVVKESREIEGIEQDVIVIRLVDDPTSSKAAGQSEASVFSQFSGPCANRPDSSTCPDPQPIEFINSVPPDCDGVIELEFKGCAVVGKNIDDCGIVIDCSIGLTESCAPPFLPDDTGKLPTEYTPVVIPPPIPPEPPIPPPTDSISSPSLVAGELPYTDCFRFQTATDFVIVSGQFVFVEDHSPERICAVDDPPEPGRSHDYSVSDSQAMFDTRFSVATEGVLSVSQRNVALWHGFDVTTLWRKVTTDLKLMFGPDGARRGGGIVINYRPHATIPGRVVYYIAEINYDTQELRIQRFNGTTFSPVVAITVPGLQMESWYRLIVETIPGSGPTQVSITARLLGITDPSISATLGPLLVDNYLPAEGHYGFGTNRAQTRFSFFRVEEFSG